MKEEIKEIIDDAYLDMTIDNLVDGEVAYDVRVKENFNTACWTFKDDKHIIFIGEQIVENAKKTKENIEHYVASYLYHEVGHSLYTERDLAVVKTALDSQKIPFALFNLAEDARIEHLIRKNAERNFLWHSYEALETPISATDMLFNIIQNDGDYSNIEESTQLKKVVKFYNLFLAANSSLVVIEILIDWMKEFPDSQQDVKNLQDKLMEIMEGSKSEDGASKPLEDLMDSFMLQTNSKKLEEALDSSESLTQEDDDGEAAAPDKDDVEVNSVNISSHTSKKVSAYTARDWDEEKAKMLAEHFKELFVEKKGYVSTKKPSRRINKKAFRPGACTDKLFKSKQINRPSKSNIVIILDCSGSMSGYPMKEMQVVVGVFNELVKQGVVDAKVILSGVINDMSAHETFQMPVTYDVIGKMQGLHDAEGIEDTMKANIDLLLEADNVFVLTDGNIWDKPIEKEEYHIQGIYTTGIYIGNIEYCNLNAWFDKGVAVEKVEDCVDELIKHLKDV